MFYHLRRAKHQTEKYQQLVAKCDPAALERVQELLKMLTMENSDDQSMSSSLKDGSKGDGSTAGDAPQPASEAKATKPKAAKPETPAKPKTPTKPKATKPKANGEKKLDAKPKQVITTFKKEYYKNNNTYGVRKYEDGQKKGQIFCFGHKTISKQALDELSCKVIHDLNKYTQISEEKLGEIILVTKHKAWKLQSGGK